ncbi:hypothetical protein TNCT_128431 [Trichonephila clavata]|uniref:Uncharacterized protein n=1 Tax=Trichonephila clavata TaxID=2740835 RepID=A0A8X6IUM6_TRICU|nr:hypothetical protein TNCT_128431 [Trichonephila clavata]
MHTTSLLKHQTLNVTDSNKIIETHFERHFRLPLMIIASICILEALISREPNFRENNNCLKSLLNVLTVGEREQCLIEVTCKDWLLCGVATFRSFGPPW